MDSEGKRPDSAPNAAIGELAPASGSNVAAPAFGTAAQPAPAPASGTAPAPKKRSDLARLLDFAGDRKPLVYLGCALSAVSMLLSFGPYICIWLVARDLIAVAPDWSAATGLAAYGWAAFAFAVVSILFYFAGLMCTHLAAFRTASNMKKRCSEHLMSVSLGYFDTHASGELRRVIDGCANATEGLIAHKTPDSVGSVAMVAGIVVVLFAFDWRMGLACLTAAVVSFAAMCTMMGGESANFMRRYQEALVNMSRVGTEYVRGIPVVKVFQQTVASFKAFHDAIQAYSDMAENYSAKVCQKPQVFQLAVVNGIVVLLVPVALLCAPGATDFAAFFTDFVFYAVFSGIIATAMLRLMFVSEEMQIAGDAVMRVESLLAAPVPPAAAHPRRPADNSVAFDHATFAYEGAERNAVEDVTFEVPAGTTVALVGPSGGGKTTLASLVPRFWDVDAGAVRIGGVDVREIDQAELMRSVAFVFQTNRLFKQSILDNVRAGRPDATREEAMAALTAAQCDDILEKLPHGVDTVVGTGAAHLSGGEVQRIALARAILKDAPIVVLDEATAFADPENEALIQKALANLARGRTVLMIAHRLSTVAGADSICVMDGGRLVERGSHAELVAAGGTYARMWADYTRAVTWKIERSVSDHVA